MAISMTHNVIAMQAIRDDSKRAEEDMAWATLKYTRRGLNESRSHDYSLPSLPIIEA